MNSDRYLDLCISKTDYMFGIHAMNLTVLAFSDVFVHNTKTDYMCGEHIINLTV